MASLQTGRPRFPQNLPLQPLLCPRVGRPSSAFTKRICYYVHEYILVPFSRWYMGHCKIEPPMCIHHLPFGLVLKRHSRVHEQEGLAMNLARAMGVPAPRFISCGSLGQSNHSDPSICDSILMTRVPGTPLDQVDQSKVDWDVIVTDLTDILTRMRSYASPFGDAVCGVAGEDIRGPMIPASPMARCTNEDEFKARMRPFIARWHALDRVSDGVPPEEVETLRALYRSRLEVLETSFFGQPPHVIVFTHGDLNPQNIMLGPDGHICGIIDWEGGAWLPEYWEISITAIAPSLPWGKFMDQKVSGGVYAQELRGHQALLPFVGNSFSY